MVADSARLERGLRQILWDLRDYLPELVIIGGWVPHLYRVYGGFDDWIVETPFTTEVDLLVQPPIARMGYESIPDILRKAGFEPIGGDRAAAAWAKDPDAGEKVEFLMAHRGTARQRGGVVPMPDQEGLGAISLDGLDLLRRHTTVLHVTLGKYDGAVQQAAVNLPRLGAFAVNKAVTFPRRNARVGEAVNPKRSKDLLYLRDLMSAGEQVISRIETDIREIARGDGSAKAAIRMARSNVRLALYDTLQRILPEVADAVAVRAGTSPESALADVRGHLTDFVEIIEEVLDS